MLIIHSPKPHVEDSKLCNSCGVLQKVVDVDYVGNIMVTYIVTSLLICLEKSSDVTPLNDVYRSLYLSSHLTLYAILTQQALSVRLARSFFV